MVFQEKCPFCFERQKYSDTINYQEIEQLYQGLKELDKLLDTEDMRSKLFGASSNKYEYMPLVRSTEDEESNYYRPPYMKVKLPLTYNEEKPMFRLFDKNNNGDKSEIELKSFNDVCKHMRYMTKHGMIIQIQKLYAMKTASGGDRRKYGLTVKLIAAECSNAESCVNDKSDDLFHDF